MHTHTAHTHKGGFLWEHTVFKKGVVHVDWLIIKTATEGIISQGHFNPCFKHNVYVYLCAEDRRKKGGRKRWRAAADS